MQPTARPQSVNNNVNMQREKMVAFVNVRRYTLLIYSVAV